ncbi:MAG: hypothetical protein ACREO9_11085, partial [Lysobacterales bacterium]
MNGLFTQESRTRGGAVFTALISLLVGMVASSAALAVDNTQFGYAGAEAGDWGGASGAIIGPADGTCANMGAVGKVNLASNFGFAIPGGATITAVTAYVKAGENGPQNVDLQLAADASVDPPTLLGTANTLAVAGTGGSCASTTVVSVGTTPASWGTTSAAILAVVNSSDFGLVFTKTEASSIKVDAMCLQISYTTAAGEATLEECFQEPPPDNNQITVV